MEDAKVTLLLQSLTDLYLLDPSERDTKRESFVDATISYFDNASSWDVQSALCLLIGAAVSTKTPVKLATLSRIFAQLLTDCTMQTYLNFGYLVLGLAARSSQISVTPCFLSLPFESSSVPIVTVEISNFTQILHLIILWVQSASNSLGQRNNVDGGLPYLPILCSITSLECCLRCPLYVRSVVGFWNLFYNSGSCEERLCGMLTGFLVRWFEMVLSMNDDITEIEADDVQTIFPFATSLFEKLLIDRKSVVSDVVNTILMLLASKSSSSQSWRGLSKKAVSDFVVPHRLTRLCLSSLLHILSACRLILREINDVAPSIESKCIFDCVSFDIVAWNYLSLVVEWEEGVNFCEQIKYSTEQLDKPPAAGKRKRPDDVSLDVLEESPKLPDARFKLELMAVFKQLQTMATGASVSDSINMMFAVEVIIVLMVKYDGHILRDTARSDGVIFDDLIRSWRSLCNQLASSGLPVAVGSVRRLLQTCLFVKPDLGGITYLSATAAFADVTAELPLSMALSAQLLQVPSEQLALALLPTDVVVAIDQLRSTCFLCMLDYFRDERAPFRYFDGFDVDIRLQCFRYFVFVLQQLSLEKCSGLDVCTLRAKLELLIWTFLSRELAKPGAMEWFYMCNVEVILFLDQCLESLCVGFPSSLEASLRSVGSYGCGGNKLIMHACQLQLRHKYLGWQGNLKSIGGGTFPSSAADFIDKARFSTVFENAGILWRTLRTLSEIILAKGISDDIAQWLSTIARLRCWFFAVNIISGTNEVTVLTAEMDSFLALLPKAALCADRCRMTVAIAVGISISECLFLGKPLPLQFDLPNCSESSNLETLICGTSNAIICSHLTQRQGALKLLGSMVISWSKANVSLDENCLSVIFTEICSLSRFGILQHLCSGDCTSVVKAVYLPLITFAISTRRLSEAALVLRSFTKMLATLQGSFPEMLAPALMTTAFDSRLGGNEVKQSETIKQLQDSVVEIIDIPKLPSPSDCPDVLFMLLMSDAIGDDTTGMGGKAELLRRLQGSYPLLDKGAVVDSDRDWVLTFSCSTFQFLLLRLVWELGGRHHDHAKRAISVLACLLLDVDWFKNDFSNKECLDSIRFQGNSALLVSNNFLYIMSNLVQQKWFEYSQRQQQQAVTSLRCLLSLLPNEHLARFLPKIITVMDTALLSQSPMVRFSAVRMLEELCVQLPLQALLPNLLLLSSYLSSVLEGKFDGSDPKIRASADLLLCLRINDPFKPSVCGVIEESSDIISVLFESTFCESLDVYFAKLSKEKSVGLLMDLFVKRFGETGEYLKDVVYLPALPELDAVRSVHRRMLESQTLFQQFEHCLGLLNHESAHIRRAALQRLCHLCKSNRSSLEKSFACVSFGQKGEHITSEQAIRAMQLLLRLCSKESDSIAMVLCASCLGLLGALDPGLIAQITNRANVTASASTDDTDKEKNWIPPWELTVCNMGVHLLQGHLVPCLRASATGQDRAGFAIQEVLQRLAKEFSGSTLGSSIPQGLRTVLSEIDVLETVQPFWTTRYTMKDVSAIKLPPLFDPSVSFTRWIGQWARFLGTASKGGFSDYFSACRGAVRSLSGLSQFLLPYLIADLLLQSTATIDGVVAEICLVLQTGQSNHTPASMGNSAMAVQAIFELLDVLSYWAYIQVGKQSTVGNTPTSTPRPSPQVGVTSETKELQDGLRRLIGSVPKHMLCAAALRIHAYGRAVRYFETLIRDDLNSRAGLVKRNDGSAGSLPVLYESELDDLLTLYSRLEEGDAVRGVLSLRHIGGHSLTFRSRILEAQQREDWLRVLSEYNSLHWLVNSGVSSATEESTLFRGAGEFLQLRAIEQGRLRCLIELGQLESAIDQAIGTMQQHPELEEGLVHLGAEASWRLMNWGSLSRFLSSSKHDNLIIQEPDVSFQMNVGSLLSCLHDQYQRSFDSSQKFKIQMTRARKEVMQHLASAGKESYDRAYPHMLRLHVLQEIDDVFDLGEQLQNPSSTAAGRSKLLHHKLTPERLQMLATGPSRRSLCQGVRRSLFALVDCPGLVAQNWLEVNVEQRKLGHYESAGLALRNAELWGLQFLTGASVENAELRQEILLQECLLLKESGHIGRALELIEPIEVDIHSFRERFLGRNVQTGDITKKSFESRKLHLATQLMVQGRLRLGRVIAERYSLLSQVQPDNEDVHFEFGKYLEHLYYDLRTRDDTTLLNTAASGVKVGTVQKASVAVADELKQQRQQSESTAFRFAKQAIEMYCRSLSVGNTLTMQVLPRMLTLWLSFAALRDPSTATTDGSSKSASKPTVTTLATVQKSVNEIVMSHANTVPPNRWYTCMSQVVSRLGHPNAATQAVLQQILERLLITFPSQGIWHVACLVGSLGTDRSRQGHKILERCSSALLRKSPDKAAMLREAPSLFSDLIKLAEAFPQQNERKLRWAIGQRLNLSRFLVPSQSVLVTPPAEDLGTNCTSSSPSHQSSNENMLFSSADQLYIAEFIEWVDVAASKARPKTVSLLTTSGVKVRFLCKQEKDGDLRKDSRLMEFNSVVNRLLSEDAEGRSRGLRMRTYAVVCLNEECGLLEWVENTRCIRHLISDAYKCWPDPLYTPPNMKEILTVLPDMQSRHRLDIPSLVSEYQQRVLGRSLPAFHRWFLYTYEDPTKWMQARTRFSRSAAVWSVVGHVVGLGDRHTENILLDISSGECVHVDFDCLFDKGLSLQKPEIVPFRLTPNMVDAMGLTGVEGVFRCSMEVCLSILRDHSEVLLAVIEPFLRDPTVNWRRSGRAQRNGGENGASSKAAVAAGESEFADAKAALTTIAERLLGLYNISHPNADALLRAHQSRTGARLARGVGSVRKEELVLSVQGQVQRLIDEATAPENLAQMFIGWMPWV